MRENEDNSITIHKAKSKTDAICELTENLVAVNVPFLTVLVKGEGDDNRFYELVRQKLVDLGDSYACQFIFKSFGGFSNMQKPDGLSVIHPAEVPDKLYVLNLKSLPGVGLQTRDRLMKNGISSIKQLCSLDRSRLKAVWGNIWGEKVW